MKNRDLIRDTCTEKVRFKMHKSKKQWLVSSVATFALGLGIAFGTNSQVLADTVSSNADASPTTEVTKTDETTSENKTETTTATTQSGDKTVTSNAVATAKPEEKTVTRTIHYVDQDGKTVAPDVMQTVKLTRATEDSAWASENTTFSALANPKIDGYVAKDKDVAEEQKVTEKTENSEVTVHYLSKQTNEYYFSAAGKAERLAKAKISYKDAELTKKVTRTIKFVDDTGKSVSPDVVQTVTLTRATDQDKWVVAPDSAEKSFAEIKDFPKVEGYSAATVIQPITNIDPETNYDKTVTYLPVKPMDDPKYPEGVKTVDDYNGKPQYTYYEAKVKSGTNAGKIIAFSNNRSGAKNMLVTIYNSDGSIDSQNEVTEGVLELDKTDQLLTVYNDETSGQYVMNGDTNAVEILTDVFGERLNADDYYKALDAAKPQPKVTNYNNFVGDQFFKPAEVTQTTTYVDQHGKDVGIETQSQSGLTGMHYYVNKPSDLVGYESPTSAIKNEGEISQLSHDHPSVTQIIHTTVDVVDKVGGIYKATPIDIDISVTYKVKDEDFNDPTQTMTATATVSTNYVYQATDLADDQHFTVSIDGKDGSGTDTFSWEFSKDDPSGKIVIQSDTLKDVAKTGQGKLAAKTTTLNTPFVPQTANITYVYQGTEHPLYFKPQDENGNPLLDENGDPISIDFTGVTGEVIKLPDIPGYEYTGSPIIAPATDDDVTPKIVGTSHEFTVQFMDGKTSVGSFKTTGQTGKPISIPADNIPANYSIDTSTPIYVPIGDTVVDVPVNPEEKEYTIQIKFGTKTVGTATITGKPGEKIILGDEIPEGYEPDKANDVLLPSDSTNPVDVPVVGTQHDVTVTPLDKDGKPIIGEDGQPITLTVPGQTGEPITIPDDQVPAGYKIQNPTGVITPAIDDPANPVKVPFEGKAASLSITYVDAVDGTVGNDSMTGLTGETGTYPAKAPTNYVLADGQSASVAYQFDAGKATTDNLVINVQHGTSIETDAPTNVNDSAYNATHKSIEIKVDGLLPNKTAVPETGGDQTIVFKRSYTLDAVTGLAVGGFGAWTQATNFSTVQATTTGVATGYKPAVAEVVESNFRSSLLDFAKNTEDLDFVAEEAIADIIAYDGIEHKFTIQVRNRGGAPIGEPIEVTGKTGEPIGLPDVEGYEYTGDPILVPTTDTKVDEPVEGIEHTFTVQPRDSHGNPIGGTITLTGRTGEPVTMPNVEVYDFSGQPVTVPTTDKNVEEPFEGTYHNITIQPMDKDGNPIGGPLTVGAQTGEPVTIPAPEGYEYIGSPLTMPTTDESYDLPYQGILHEFSFVPLDENGNPIGDPIILTGRTGEVITIPDIPGYNFEGGEITVPAKDTVSGNYIHIAENPENSEADLIKPVSHSNNNSANNSQTKLPQTSEKSSVAMSLLGLASVAISLFALAGASKKRKKD